MARQLMAHLRPRPLDWVRSIKVKLGLVVVGSVTVTVGAIYGSVFFGLHTRFAFVGGLLVSLVAIQLLAHGMVLPLREMATATRVMAAGDYSQRVTATAQDEVGSLARSFNTMAAKLDQVERQRRELLANVSHELRTPIAALRARLENLADGVEALDAEAVATMLKGTERLSRLVDQLLELSQFESGAIRIDRQNFGVREVVEDAAAQVRPVSRDVRIVTDVDNGLVGVGDPERIFQTLTNLLANAVRHSPAGGEVKVRGAPMPGGVRIEVSDCGAGVPAGDIDRIFDRFYRVDGARGSGAGGAGLGLAIARSIVELHGGSIRAAPREPAGCRIVVDLPN
ncbi:MAG TPA: ATP-binding protein [Streptosporangiaceae bacterium]|nr:ATP-binding protein [Streptosporangiaceae bacterium]